MRRRRTALWLAAALALGSPVPAQAQDVTPPADTEEDPEDPEATLVRLRQRVRDAEGAARAAAAVNLATFFGEQRRWLAAADAWGVARRIEESAEHCLGEARARLAFAEEVLSAGGIGAGIRAAFEDARLGLSRARKNGADTAEVAIGLARCAEAQGNPDAALRELERALARWPEDPVPRRRLAFACLNAGRHERAAELLQELAAAAPDEALLWRALA